MGLPLTRLRQLLTTRDQRRAALLLGAMVLAGFIDVAGVTSILPFMAVVANPAVIETNRWLHTLFTGLAFDSPQRFLIGLGLGALGLLLLSNAVSLATAAAILRFASRLGHHLSRRILTSYLRQPYAYFLDHNTSHLVVSCTEDVVRVTNGIVAPTLQALAKGVIVLSLLLLVLWVDPWLALSVGLVLGTLYTGVFLGVRHFVTRLGAASKHAHRERVRLATEMLHGIKELKILGQDQAYPQRFAHWSAVYARNQWLSATVTLVPRYAIESLAFGSMIGVVLYLLATHRAFTDAMPVLVLYAFTAYRLLPAFQQLFSSATQIRFNLSSLEALEAQLTGSARVPVREAPPRGPEARPRVTFEREIVLRNIRFAYSPGRAPVLDQFTLTIPRNATIALVGSTGAGKTTIVDLILGLIAPQHGSLLVDGLPITAANVTAWQQQLGYVPQHIYVADDSLAANIAFGVLPDQIDMERVREAARIANLDEFVREELPDGYATRVGERGVALSGGQRQRIGIARALYSDPDVLILDEATSALDGITEDAVTDAIRTIFHEKTIIMIAHRLGTVHQADRIYLLEAGGVADQGRYAELLARNKVFRAMAKVDG
ncbi:ABC transporter ATP-binding protein [Candidatus Nitrospira nitrificans]|uniref:ABC transporter related protein n=2 Tax=Candidatus Nitrospira nitrificans TaxID=1742973 RepID=A0A0S4LAT6_9BACT|nr:ABC transporter ATP-binding protein [Candidatus Nitrospira nitrificans]CUS32955.1 ABC transporter related protein [Candidatus Nitrospira nitrificans]